MAGLFAIPAHRPFLPDLAAGLLARGGEDPLALARMLVLLPTRRAARGLQEAFLALAGARALLLPRMGALAGLSVEEADELALPAMLAVPPAVNAARRQAVLSAMVSRIPAAAGGPATPDQAWRLAAALAAFLDEVALEGCTLDALDGLVPETLARHWQVTTVLLRGIAADWRDWLAAQGLSDIGERRVAALRAQAEAWRADPPDAPIIVAGLGAGGTIPAAAELLAVVAALPGGAIVLQGAPEPPDPALWAAFAASPAHPLSGQARLLRALGATPAELRPWPVAGDAPPAGAGVAGRDAGASARARAPGPADGAPMTMASEADGAPPRPQAAARATGPDDAPPAASSVAAAHPRRAPGDAAAARPSGPGHALPTAATPGRAALLAAALRPAEAAGPWSRHEPARWAPALAGLTRHSAPDPQAEAAAIALLLREALERPGARVALVTPDRDLARRVSAECARHGITADDSAGEPLMETPAAAFLRLLARMVGTGFAPVPLLACLKHPLAAAGMDRAAWLAALRRFEHRALRGARPAAGLAALREVGGAPAAPLLDALEAALGPFTALPMGPARPPADLLAEHLAAAERLATTPDRPGPARLYAGEEGEPLAAHLADLASAIAELPPASPAAWPALFDAALEGPLAPSVRAVRGRASDPHPRVAILGLLEARLQAFDRVVLGGLEEGVWPPRAEPGPWMGRPMRRQFGLPEPEARIGRVASDAFTLAAASGEVVLSAAARRDGAPTVPSRWLTRIEAFLAGQGGLRLPESPAAAWAAALDRPARVTPCARPAPAPPISTRPLRLTPSSAATLIADPYAFYAQQVLGLRRLPALDEDPGARDYGEIVHAAMAAFLAALGPGWPGEAAALGAWGRAAGRALAELGPRPALLAFWRPRLARIGQHVVAEERRLRQEGGLLDSRAEVTGSLRLRTARGTVELAARADRLDRFADGWRVLDVKTGTAPPERAVLSGAQPQLPLEAAILEGGGFEGIPAGASVIGLTYWRLTGGTPPGEARDIAAVTADGVPLAALARERLARLADRFLLGEAPFLARPHPDRGTFGDTDHLARVAEWSAAEEGGG
jgi:ATP-dependent helicase/nuclease subunit B